MLSRVDSVSFVLVARDKMDSRARNASPSALFGVLSTGPHSVKHLLPLGAEDETDHETERSDARVERDVVRRGELADDVVLLDGRAER
jgi:hypothetical protein